MWRGRGSNYIGHAIFRLKDVDVNVRVIDFLNSYENKKTHSRDYKKTHSREYFTSTYDYV